VTNAQRVIAGIIEGQPYKFWATMPSVQAAREFADELMRLGLVDEVTPLVYHPGRFEFVPFPGKFKEIQSRALDYGGTAVMQAPPQISGRSR